MRPTYDEIKLVQQIIDQTQRRRALYGEIAASYVDVKNRGLNTYLTMIVVEYHKIILKKVTGCHKEEAALKRILVALEEISETAI